MAKKLLNFKQFCLIVSLIILFFIARKFYISFFVKIKTEAAKVVKFDEFVDAEALVVRNEKVLRNDSKFLRLFCNENSRVAKNQCLARAYKSEDDMKADIIDNQDGWGICNVFGDNNRFNNRIRSILYECGIKKVFGFHNKERGVACEKLLSENSGFFSCYTDGFEEVLCTDIDDEKIKKLDIKKYKKINKRDKNIVGKLIFDDKCIIICFVDKNIDFENKNYYMKFSLDKNEIKINLVRTLNIGNNKIAAVFSSDLANILLNSRYENVKIKIKSVEGIKIKSKYIHIVDNQKGVFLQNRKVIKFKPIEIIYDHGDFVICKHDDKNPNSIQENDLIIMKNYGLYDGKIIVS